VEKRLQLCREKKVCLIFNASGALINSLGKKKNRPYTEIKNNAEQTVAAKTAAG